jgi:hypothetical protein
MNYTLKASLGMLVEHRLVLFAAVLLNLLPQIGFGVGTALPGTVVSELGASEYVGGWANSQVLNQDASGTANFLPQIFAGRALATDDGASGKGEIHCVMIVLEIEDHLFRRHTSHSCLSSNDSVISG